MKRGDKTTVTIYRKDKYEIDYLQGLIKKHLQKEIDKMDLMSLVVDFIKMHEKEFLEEVKKRLTS